MQRIINISTTKLLLFGVLFFSAIGVLFVGRVLIADYREDICYQKTEHLWVDNPDELVEVSEEEKERLKFGNLIPTRRHYEIQKCVFGGYVLAG